MFASLLERKIEVSWRYKVRCFYGKIVQLAVEISKLFRP
jgi:hypothetical protein